MSRITNSILLRYGITQFWSASLFKQKSLSLLLTLNCFLILIFKNYFLQIVKTQYLLNSITIYILKINRDKFSFLEKYLILKKKLTNYNKINSRKKYFIKYKSSLNNDSVSLKLKKLSFVTKLWFFTFFTLYFLKKKFNYLQCISLMPFFFKKKSFKKKIFIIKKFNIKKINYYIQLKLLSLFISNLIFNYTTKDISVIIKTMSECIQFTKLPFFFNKKRINFEKKQTIFRILLSFMFFKASLITTDINRLLINVKNKKHINTVRSYLELVKIIFIYQRVPLSGIKIQLAGRLNGKLRKSRFGYVLGSVKLMKFDIDCNFSFESVYTPYGVFSLRT